MRPIEEIKADLNLADKEMCTAGAIKCIREWSQVEAELNSWWKALPIERKQDICQAERDGRLCVLPTRQEEIIHAINVALRIELYDWQITYIFGASDYLMPGRCTGKTLAYILRMLISEGELLDFSTRESTRKLCDEWHGQAYVDWFKHYTGEIIYKLSVHGSSLKLRKVYFTRGEAARGGAGDE